MKRRLTSLLAASVVAGVMFLLPSSPASAATSVCLGQGRAATGAPIFYPGFGPLLGTTTSANFSFELGACVDAVGVRLAPLPGFASVTVTGAAPGVGGWCGHSVGVGGTADGHHPFEYKSAGSVLLVHPPVGSTTGAIGIVNAIPDATAGESCTTGADQFLVTGAVALI